MPLCWALSAWSGCDAISPDCKSTDCKSTDAEPSARRLLAQLTASLQRTLPSAHLETISLALRNDPSAALTLALINADFDTGPLSAEVMHAVIAEPAYWAFCWGSGLALARFVLSNPEWVRGRRVLDFGSGSGVAGIAAALAGADRVHACDNDPDALLATRTNAALNQITVQPWTELADLQSAAEPIDLILVADVLYDRANLALLESLEALGAPLLIADSRIADLEPWGYQSFAAEDAQTLPNLGEFDEFRTVRLFARA